MAATIPAAVAGLLLEGLIASSFRSVGIVALMLVVGGVIMLLADRLGARTRSIGDVTFPIALGIGTAQALALVPGISRSGASITAGRIAGLDREPAARFAFLMATPITLGAILFEARGLLTGEIGVEVSIVPSWWAWSPPSSRAWSPSGSCSASCDASRSTCSSSIDFGLAAVVLVVWLAR